MFIQHTVQNSPIEASKLVDKIDALVEEGYSQVVVTALDTGENKTYGLNASKIHEE